MATLIASAFAPSLAVAADREWFADHGRRSHRVRPSLPGEPSGMAVLVRRRDGFVLDRVMFDLSGAAPAFELGADDAALGMVWANLQRLPPAEIKGKAAESLPRRLFKRLFGLRRLTA